METTDRGLIDVERYDIDPSQRPFHGLEPGVDSTASQSMVARDKVPHVLRILEADKLSARSAASMVDIAHSVSTWPQLASDVSLGAALVASTIRMIGLGERVPSGRGRLDIAEHLKRMKLPEIVAADT